MNNYDHDNQPGPGDMPMQEPPGEADEMRAVDTRKSWVAFNAEGFPIGFSTLRPGVTTIAQASKDHPTAQRIELLDTEAWKHQLDIHSGRESTTTTKETDQ
jgi:hypothetical protein